MLGNNTALYTYTSYNHISAGLPLTSAHVDRQLTEATPHPTGVGPVSQSSPRTQRNCPESSFIRSAAIPHSSDNSFPRRDDHEPSRVCTYAHGPSLVPCSSDCYVRPLTPPGSRINIGRMGRAWGRGYMASWAGGRAASACAIHCICTACDR